MPLATSYDESTLADFMVAELSATGAALGLTDASDGIASAVLATARLLGDDIANLTDMALLEAAARWHAWQAALKAAAGNFDLKAGSADLKRSQVFEHINSQLALSETAYYVAVSESEAASGSGGSFYFSLAGSCRGR